MTCDFTYSSKEGFFEKAMDDIGDLDISILVNNVGVAKGSIFHQLTIKYVKLYFTINCLPQIIFSKLFIPRMLKR